MACHARGSGHLVCSLSCPRKRASRLFTVMPAEAGISFVHCHARGSGHLVMYGRDSRFHRNDRFVKKPRSGPRPGRWPPAGQVATLLFYPLKPENIAVLEKKELFFSFFFFFFFFFSNFSTFFIKNLKFEVL